MIRPGRKPLSDPSPALEVPAQSIPVPSTISPQAQAFLAAATHRIATESAASTTRDLVAGTEAAMKLLSARASGFDGAQTPEPGPATNRNGERGVHRHQRTCMNWDTIEGNWKQLAGQTKAQWGKLTGDDLREIAGRRDQLAGKIQERYGIAKDEAERQLEEWAAKAEDSWLG